MADSARIRHLAHLARLSLTEDEVAALAEEAERVLALFDRLPHAEAADEAPRTESGGRADEPAPSDPAVVEAILAQVARRDGRIILVPKGGE